MLVVADSSPLILLIHIGHVDVLPTLFRQVVITAYVPDEHEWSEDFRVRTKR